MFTVMQDPAVASRLAHLHVQDRFDAAARHRLARIARTKVDRPSLEPTPIRRPGARRLPALRPSFR
jgi:hypothetical protein